MTSRCIAFAPRAILAIPSLIMIVAASCGGRSSVGGVVCGTKQIACAGSCTTIEDDPRNCGACGNICPQGTVCYDGACTTSCGGGTLQCGQSCVDPSVDPANCGACGHACPDGQPCTGGQCRYECPPGQTLCGASCVTLASDTANCGACGRTCIPAHGGAACVGGQCEITFCAAGYGDCDSNPDNGCEADIGSDPASCGRCGHDCCGGACVNGMCQPVEVTQDAYQAMDAIAVDANNLYMGFAGGSVSRCSKTNCVSTTVVGYLENHLLHSLAVDSNFLYWSAPSSVYGAGGAIAKCPTSGCGATPIELVTGLANPGSLALDSTNVYWVDESDETINACSLGGCSSPTQLATGQKGAWLVTLGGAYVYWTLPGAIMRCEKSNCTPEQVVLVDVPMGIWSDGSSLYWTAWNGGGTGPVMTCDPNQGCTTTSHVLATGQQYPYEITGDANNVYWSVGGGPLGGVLACAKNGCGGAPTALAFPQSYPQSVVTDASCVYWKSPGYYVWAVAKP